MWRLKDARKGHLQPTAIQFSLQGVTEYAGDINMTSGYIQVIVMFGSIFFGQKNELVSQQLHQKQRVLYIYNWSPNLRPYPFKSETCANT